MPCGIGICMTCVLPVIGEYLRDQVEEAVANGTDLRDFSAALKEQLVAKGFDVFLDLKFHDIPNTTAQACKAAAMSASAWAKPLAAASGPMFRPSAYTTSTCFMPRKPRKLRTNGVCVSVSHVAYRVKLGPTCEEENNWSRLPYPARNGEP